MINFSPQRAIEICVSLRNWFFGASTKYNFSALIIYPYTIVRQNQEGSCRNVPLWSEKKFVD